MVMKIANLSFSSKQSICHISYIMSNVCCKQLKGWCKSFTRTETYLSLVQVLFLIVLITFLTFIILHFIACSIKSNNKDKINQNIVKSTIKSFTEELEEQVSGIPPTEINITSESTQLSNGVECTWTPSYKTEAVTHYYDIDSKIQFRKQNLTKLNQTEHFDDKTLLPNDKDLDRMSDGEVVDEVKNGFLLALVKIRPPQDVTFGCTLTIVARKWTVTAASCIEAIEEVDSLDSFVMMRGFGDRNHDDIYTISDVLIHPQYQGANKTYDLAVLKSEHDVVKNGIRIITLPNMVDYLLTTIGQKFSVLGYGKFRNFDKDPLSRKVRGASVYRLPLMQCPGDGGSWSPRHLWGGRGIERGGCGDVPICIGVLRARSRPCHYCAGALLIYKDTLIGLMADNQHCGIDCEPALYVNVALLRNWLDSVIDTD